MNFKQETLHKLEAHQKKIEDIKFIQCSDFKVSNTVNEILELMNFDYDNGYGWAVIRDDLVIVGNDWWLERHENDGSEWWEYKEQPKPLTEQLKINNYQKLLDKHYVFSL